MCSFLWCVRPVVSCFSASFITICDSLQGTLRNINMQWEVCLLIAYGKEYALGKGCVLLSSLSHHLQKSLGARVFLQTWLRLSHFLPAYYSKCSCAFNKMVIFCHSSALVDVLFLRECTAFISYPCVLHNDKMSHFDIMLCPMRRNYKSAQLETNEIIMESPMKESKSSYNKD